jgi:hypothetical protein
VKPFLLPQRWRAILSGNVVDNMIKSESRCDIALLDDNKQSISAKTISANQEPLIAFVQESGQVHVGVGVKR